MPEKPEGVGKHGRQIIPRVVPPYLGAVTGIITFVYFAFDRPVFGDVVFDIALYLLLGFLGLAIFYFEFFIAAKFFGVDALVRDDKVRALGVIVLICGTLVAGAAIPLVAALIKTLV